MTEARLKLCALALAGVAALAIGGCGGDDEDTSTATTRSTATTPSIATTPDPGSRRSAPATQDADRTRKPSNKESGGSRRDRSSSSSDASREAPQEGSSVAAPGVPLEKGGDNSLQTYGLEAGSDERVEATAFVQAYLDARAAGEWEKACSHITAEHRRSFEKLAPGEGCGAAMAAFAKGSAAIRAAETRIDVLSFRVGGKSAVLIYGRPDGHVYATAIAREGGEWKVITTLPLQLDD